MIDLSHLNEAGFWDVARITPGPLVATHSAVHHLCESSRNLTDAQLEAIGASGGLVGIIFGSAFLRADFAEDRDTPVELIAAHARYVADLIGVEHVALGSDFDGTMIPDGVGDVTGLTRVLDALAAVGFDEGDLAAIAHRNWRRVLAAWWSG
jgi:membrane dipeptidase